VFFVHSKVAVVVRCTVR